MQCSSPMTVATLLVPPAAHLYQPRRDSVLTAIHVPLKPQDHGLQSLLSRFSTLLPRELRDIVYEHLLGPPEPWMIAENRSIVSKPRPSKPHRRPKLSKYISQGFFSPWMLDEMAEAFYRTNMFEVARNCSDADLEAFLQKDFLGSRCIPNNHIRHITMPVKAPRMFFEPGGAAVQRLFDAQETATFKTIHHRASSLAAMIPRSRRCTIEFVVQEHAALPMLLTFKLLAPSVFDLQEAGFTVDVTRTEAAWTYSNAICTLTQTVFTDLFNQGSSLANSRMYWDDPSGWGLSGDIDSEKLDTLRYLIRDRLDGYDPSCMRAFQMC